MKEFRDQNMKLAETYGKLLSEIQELKIKVEELEPNILQKKQLKLQVYYKCRTKTVTKNEYLM